MARHSIGLWLGLSVMGCATSEVVTEVPGATASAVSGGERKAERAEDAEKAERAEDAELVRAARRGPSTNTAGRAASKQDRQDRQVAVAGIEGTLSGFDVRVTLEKQGDAFARCHEPRARRMPALAGKVAFQIHVLRDGLVGDVHVSESDLGDRVLERCLSDVIRSARFPTPNGGEADVTWRMLLEPARKQATEQWATERIKRVLQKQKGALLETCDAERLGPFTVTAYVSRRGRVLAAGVAAQRATSAETIDCIAKGLRSWSMPKPRKAIAKVSFPLRTGA